VYHASTETCKKYDTTSCDEVCQWLAAGRWFSPGNIVKSGVKHHNPNPTKSIPSL
jgi:hypothetical protein